MHIPLLSHWNKTSCYLYRLSYHRRGIQYCQYSTHPVKTTDITFFPHRVPTLSTKMSLNTSDEPNESRGTHAHPRTQKLLNDLYLIIDRYFTEAVCIILTKFPLLPGKFRCSQWRKFRQPADISVSMLLPNASCLLCKSSWNSKREIGKLTAP